MKSVVFNPLTVITNIDDEPMKEGTINDPKKKAEINVLRMKLAKAPKDEQLVVQEELRVATENAQPELTVGSAIITVLTNPLPDADDKERRREEAITGEAKLDLTMLAIEIKKAMRACESVRIDEKDAALIKERVNRGYTNPLVVGRIFRAMKVEEEVEEKKE